MLACAAILPRVQTSFSPLRAASSYAEDLIRCIRERFTGWTLASVPPAIPKGMSNAPASMLTGSSPPQKVEAGADFLITQLFYDWSDFLDMGDYLRNKRNIKVPIVPGVLPFLNTDQIKRFTSLCGSKLPGILRKNPRSRQRRRIRSARSASKCAPRFAAACSNRAGGVSLLSFESRAQLPGDHEEPGFAVTLDVLPRASGERGHCAWRITVLRT